MFIVIGSVALHAGLQAVYNLAGSTSAFVSIGLGNVPEYALSAFAAGPFPATLSQKFYNFVLFANVWQLVLSMIYFQLNGVLTAMMVSREWMSYYKNRKSLRLTVPEGTTQRTSYFISMPWKFGGPLLATSALLHWSLSQSIFVVPLEQIDKKIPENLLSNSLNTMNGFNIWAIITCKSSNLFLSNKIRDQLLIEAIIAMVFGITVCGALCAYGWTSFKTHLPQGRPTSSITISTASHQPQPLDSDAWLFPVMCSAIPPEFYLPLEKSPKQGGSQINSIVGEGRIPISDSGKYLSFTTYQAAEPLAF